MDNNTYIFNLIKDVPQEAQKKITGGRLNGMTDIKPMWRIQTLTEVFGPVGLGWYTTTTKKEIIEGANGEKIATEDILLYVNYKKPFNLKEDLWSKGIEGSGGSSFVAKEKNGYYTSDECFKMAYTDALSVACRSLGMGASVYWGDSKYQTKETKETKKEELKISPKQFEIISKVYVGDNLKKLLDTNKIKKLEDLPLTKANAIIKALMSKNKEKKEKNDMAADNIVDVQDAGDK